MADAMLRALFTNLIGGGGAVSSHSYDTLPDNDDVQAETSASDDALGAYAELASTVGSADVWSYGIHITDISAAMDAKFSLATGAGGSESIFATIPCTRIDLGTAATHIEPNTDWTWPYPVRIPNGTRLATAFKAGGTTQFTAQVVAAHITGLAG